LVGLIDTLGQVYLPQLAGMAVCGLMALVLLWRPTGLFSRG
jgi:branched-chain amino acid transport system permease protein